MLHILTHSPFQFNMKTLFNMLTSSDEILVIQSGIILAIEGNYYIQEILKYSSNLYVLKEDVYARSLSNKLSNKFVLVDYLGFVKLTERHKIQVTW